MILVEKITFFMLIAKEKTSLSDNETTKNFICLRCSNKLPKAEHGKSFSCSCGMEYISQGNGLIYFDPNIELKPFEFDFSPDIYRSYEKPFVQENKYTFIKNCNHNCEKVNYENLNQFMIEKELQSQFISDKTFKQKLFKCPYCFSTYPITKVQVEGFNQIHNWTCKCKAVFKAYHSYIKRDIDEKSKKALNIKHF